MRIRTRSIGKIATATLAVLGCTLAAPAAWATLGGDAASIAANQQHLGGAHKVEALPTGLRHELHPTANLTVHEYLSSTGAVYAVSWRGDHMPDLRELLGSYFAQLDSQKARRLGGHHHARQLADDLVFQSGGHRHQFSGRAWVPSLLPAGLNPNSIE